MKKYLIYINVFIVLILIFIFNKINVATDISKYGSVPDIIKNDSVNVQSIVTFETTVNLPTGSSGIKASSPLSITNDTMSISLSSDSTNGYLDSTNHKKYDSLVTNKPSYDSLVTNKTAYDSLVTNKNGYDSFLTNQPAYDSLVTNKAGYDSVVASMPSYDSLVANKNGYDSFITNQPSYDSLVANKSGYDSFITNQPAYDSAKDVASGLTPGTVTASKALVADSNKTLDTLNINSFNISNYLSWSNSLYDSTCSTIVDQKYTTVTVGNILDSTDKVTIEKIGGEDTAVIWLYSIVDSSFIIGSKDTTTAYKVQYTITKKP